MTEDTTDHSTELASRADEALDRIEDFVDDIDAESGVDDAAPADLEEVRESVFEVGELMSDASFDELLRAAGFEDLPEEPAPADLPRMMQAADSETMVALRRILELGDLAEEWDGTDEEELVERLERLDRETASEGDEPLTSDLGQLVSDVWESASADESSEGEGTGDEATEPGEAEADSGAEASEAGTEPERDEPAADADGEVESASEEPSADESGDESGVEGVLRAALDESFDSFRDRLDEMREQLEGAEGDESGAAAAVETEVTEEATADEADEADEADKADGTDHSAEGRPRFSTMPSRGAIGRFSTMPSSGPGSSSRFSTVRGRIGRREE